MRSIAFLLLSSLLIVDGAVRDMGFANFTCDPSVFAKSKTVPTSAHSVRFADIKIIAALGDSLTAANGAGSEPYDPLAVILQYRGLAFQIGGDKTLEEHITVPNILKKFNPDIFGYSHGIGTENVWETSKLNMGVPGAESKDIISQARKLVSTMKKHPEVDIKHDWKLVNIFIGANDVCVYCEDPYINETSVHSPHQYIENIKTAVQILKDNLPRTIVSVTGMFNMGMLRKIDHDKYFCEGLHLFECDCESHTEQYSNEEIQETCFGYMNAENDLMASGHFDTSDDFTLVVQPFLNGVVDPPYTANGTVDMTFFAADCFHFSAFGHSIVAMNLWNTIIQPVGQKQTKVDLADTTVGVRCPDTSCPFFPTTKNSKDCKSFRTQNVLD